MLLARILTPHKLSLLILIWHCTLASKEREEEDEEREEGHYTSAAAATTRLDNRNASIQALYLALLEWIEVGYFVR